MKTIKPKRLRSENKRLLTISLRDTLTVLVLSFSSCHTSTPPKMMEYSSKTQPTNSKFTCESTKTFFYVIRLTEYSGKPISFNLNTDAILGSDKYIADGTGSKRYGMYELGNNCFYHKDTSTKNANPLFVLILENSGDTVANTCKITKMITNTDLQACSGQSTEDLFGVLEVKLQSGDPASLTLFDSILKNENFAYKLLFFLIYELRNFSFSDFDERVMEMMLITPMNNRLTNAKSVSIFDYKEIKNINSGLDLNPFVSEVDRKNLIKRLVRDNLPGHFLGVYTGPGDDTSKFVQKVDFFGFGSTRSLNLQGYIAAPNMLTTGQTHVLEVMVRSFNTGSNTNAKLKDVTYRIEVTRKSSQIDFEVKREATSIITMSHGYSGGTKFVYFSLIVGGGALSFTGPIDIVAKFYERFYLYEVGKTVQRGLSTYQEATQFSKLYSTKPSTNSHSSVWVKVEYKPPPGVTKNLPGFRILEIKFQQNASPVFLIAELKSSTVHHRCYVKTKSGSICLGTALLSDPSESRFNQYLYGTNSFIKLSTNPVLVEMCRLTYDDFKCLLPMPGYIINLEKELRSPIGPFGRMRLEDFENLEEDVKKFVHVFENNVGTKYMVSCPYTCGTCGPDLKCLTCGDGTAPLANGHCSRDSCSSINWCVNCGPGGKCNWCSKNTLLLSKDACSSGCSGPGASFRHIEIKQECIHCRSSKCKTCSPYAHCSECLDQNHRLMEKALKDRLPVSKTLLGSQDCFFPSDVVDYVYTDATHFKPCMSNCKRCTSGTDCQECGSYSDPSKTYYLLDNGGPVSCTSSCDSSQNRFIVPGTLVPTCYECSTGPYYTEGSNPPECSACNIGAVWIETSTKLCKSCGSGCSSCSSNTRCQSCSDLTHFIQTDGGTCGIGCKAKEMKLAGTPKRCQPCPDPNCFECSSNAKCTLCDPNFALKEGICQPCSEGCLVCQDQGCTSCKKAMFLGKTKTCQACNEGCIDCFTTDDGKLKCLKCGQGYELKDSNCRKNTRIKSLESN